MGKKLGIVIIIILVIAGLVIGVLFAFKGKEIPVLGKVVTIPFVETASAEKVSQMFSDFEKIDSAHLAMNLEIFAKAASVQGQEGQALSLGLAPADLTMKLDLSTDFSLKDNQALSQFSLGGDLSYSGMNYTLGLEVVTTNNKAYLRATKLPAIPFFDFSAFQNQWYSYDLTEATDDLLESFKVINTNSSTAIRSGQYSEEEIQKMKGILGQSNFLVVEERLPDEKIEGTDCYHYSVKIEAEKFRQFMDKVISQSPGLGSLENSNLNLNFNVNRSLEEQLSNLEEAVDKWNENPTEIWVGKNTNYLHKISYQYRYEESEMASSGYQYIDLEGSLIFSKFNEEIDIQVPTATKTLNDLWEELKGMYGELSGSLSFGETEGDAEEEKENESPGEETVVDLSKDSDSDGLTDMEEIIYGTDENNPDSDGDGYSDGEEAADGFNPSGTGKLDSDSDGLSDAEEEDYGTDKFDEDTDDDGFLDGEEVLNGFNPNGPGRLITI